MKPKHQRLAIVGVALVFLSAAAGLVLYDLSDNMVFFHSPKDVAAKEIGPGQRFRLGGLVAEGSVDKDDSDPVVRFTVTDTAADVRVVYAGLLPALFREGQGVVAEGMLDETGLFVADTLLAKHDENYMPKEVAEALKEAGTWQGNDEEAGTP